MLAPFLMFEDDEEPLEEEFEPCWPLLYETNSSSEATRQLTLEFIVVVVVLVVLGVVEAIGV